jgi:hypothetical protein
VFGAPVEFVAQVCDRLVQAGAPAADRNAALAVLGVISADLEVQSMACRSSISEIADRLAMNPDQFIAAVKLLGRVRAVAVVSRYKQRRLAITPQDGPRVGRPRVFPDGGPVIGLRTFR